MRKEHFTIVTSSPFANDGEPYYCVGDENGRPMSDEGIADDLGIRGTLHSRQWKVVDLLRSYSDEWVSYVYVSMNGAPHIMVDDYTANRSVCECAVTELNRRYSEHIARMSRKARKAEKAGKVSR